MPRQARIKDHYGLYHIYQRSLDDREIFRSENDRRVFWDVLTGASERYSFRLLGYCMLEPTQYHLLVQLQGCDISSLMKSINISFISESGHEAGLFRDRYRSELIQDPDDLLSLSRTLQDRASGHERWNSFCTFDQKALKDAGIDFQAVRSESGAEDIIAGCSGDSCLRHPGEAAELLRMELAHHHLELSDALEDINLRNELILKIRLNSTLSLKEIGELFGGLSESSISKILRRSQTLRHPEAALLG